LLIADAKVIKKYLLNEFFIKIIEVRMD